MNVALISTLGMIIVGILSFLGTYYSSKKSTDKVTALVTYRLEELEKKQDKHNSIIERTYKIEEQCAVIEEKISVANNRIKDLEDLEKAK
jgi:prefoldin subunit 5